MLTEQRYEMILGLLEEKQSITVSEIKELLQISESTARRDITALHNAGKLIKVFGGAVAVENHFNPQESTVEQKSNINREQKMLVAKYAASLIKPEDFVYIDAGTTTGYMLDYITEKSAAYVTNAVLHARRLAADGFRVFLIGGELKGTTEAVVGNEAMRTLQMYHFVKGFFGTNGVAMKTGLTTPDVNEALIKRAAIAQCEKSYVLADSFKFGSVSSVTFAPFHSVKILTNEIPEEYRGCENVVACGE